MDLLQAFEEYIKDLEREDFQTKKQERRRTERKNRDRFVALLKTLFDKRVVNHRTKWRDFVRGISFEAKSTEVKQEPEMKPFSTLPEAEKVHSELRKYL